MEAVASYAELLAKPGASGNGGLGSRVAEKFPELVRRSQDPQAVHRRPDLRFPLRPGSADARVPEVIDCWYDSGAMPFAQWGYPHQGKDEFARQFPADFISEAIDQTRGWFYSQLAISTLLFGETFPRNPIRNGSKHPEGAISLILTPIATAWCWD
jgi:isoleucyl-tRNA synthetase